MLELEKIRTVAAEVGSQFGVDKVFLFGSYARNEATPESDVDILIEKGKIYGLLELSRFQRALEGKLRKKVDLLTTSVSDQDFLDHVRKGEILLYEATE